MGVVCKSFWKGLPWELCAIPKGCMETHLKKGLHGGTHYPFRKGAWEGVACSLSWKGAWSGALHKPLWRDLYRGCMQTPKKKGLHGSLKPLLIVTAGQSSLEYLERLIGICVQNLTCDREWYVHQSILHFLVYIYSIIPTTWFLSVYSISQYFGAYEILLHNCIFLMNVSKYGWPIFHLIN